MVIKLRGENQKHANPPNQPNEQCKVEMYPDPPQSKVNPRFSRHTTSKVTKKLIVSMGGSRIYLTEDYTQGDTRTKKEQFVKDRTLSVTLLQNRECDSEI